jgi:hypothetical protein
MCFRDPEEQVTVPYQAARANTEHTERLLQGFFKTPPYRHHFSD